MNSVGSEWVRSEEATAKRARFSLLAPHHLVLYALFLAVLYLGVFGVDHFGIVRLGLALAAWRGFIACGLGIGIHLLAELLRRLRQRLRFGVDRRLVL